MDEPKLTWVMPDFTQVESETPPEGYIYIVPNGAKLSREAFPLLWEIFDKRIRDIPIDF